MNMQLGGYLDVECLAPDGKRWRERCKNGITLAAINFTLSYVLTTLITGKAPFYFGLIDNTDFDEISEHDTLASHAGWDETQVYTSANRPIWNVGTVSGQVISDTARTSLTMSADAVLAGAFLCSTLIKVDNSGLLWMTALFAAPRTVLNGSILTLGYTCMGAAGVSALTET